MSNGTNRDLIVPSDMTRYAGLAEGKSPEQIQQTLLILLALLQGITENMLSGDAVWFSCHRALDICTAAGLPEHEVRDTLDKFMMTARRNRQRNPMNSMFEKRQR